VVVAIHQPNFLPWLPYFDKLHRSDVFVLYDDCEWSGGGWINRVRIRTSNGERYLTLPVKSGSSNLPIVDVELHNDKRLLRKMVMTVEQTYCSAPGWERHGADLAELLSMETHRFVDKSEKLIRWACSAMQMPCTVVRRSDLHLPRDTERNQKLIETVMAHGGTKYYCGRGAIESGYMDVRQWEDAGIEIVEQTFHHVPYPQAGDGFVPGMSVVDLVMNASGWALAFLRQCIRHSRVPAAALPDEGC